MPGCMVSDFYLCRSCQMVFEGVVPFCIPVSNLRGLQLLHKSGSLVSSEMFSVWFCLKKSLAILMSTQQYLIWILI